MLTAKFDPRSFFQRKENVALHVPASDVFGLLQRSLDLPAQWAALVGRSTGDHSLVPTGGVVENDEVEDVLFVRSSPIDIVLTLDNITSKDGFQWSATVQLRVSPIAERSELQSFLQTIVGSRRVIDVDGLKTYLEPAIRGEVRKFVARNGAGALGSAEGVEEASQVLSAALESSCFSAGLMLGAKPTAQFESASYRELRQLKERATVRRAEHEVASRLDEALQKARTEHLDQLAGLLNRLRTMATESPDVELPELLRTFSEHQRGELYEALFAMESPGVRTRWIVVAAGDELIFFDGQKPESPVRRYRVGGSAGPARSVQFDCEKRQVAQAEACGSEVLWVGAANGIYRWPVECETPDRVFLADPSNVVRGGFNRVAVANGFVAASHSELGIWEWDLQGDGTGRPRLELLSRGAKAIREMVHHNDCFYCSVDSRIVCWIAGGDGDAPTSTLEGSDSLISAIEVTFDGVYAGNSDGDVLFWPAGRTDRPERLHRGMNRAAESVRLIQTHGVRRLVFADTSHRVHARVLGDGFSCQYEAGGQTLRRVEVASDLLVATNELRDRLICWKPGNPGKPTAVIAVGSLTGRSIQDVCLVPLA